MLSIDNQDTFVSWFRASSPYIHAFRGRTFVVTFGGEAVDDESFPNLIHDIALLSSLGVRLVLVHGARPQIERRLKTAKVKPLYSAGLRITEPQAMPSVMEAVGAVRVQIEALLSMGLANSPMAGARIRVASGNFVTAKPLGVHEGVDYGLTGEVRRVDAEAIKQRLDSGAIVLISPLGYSPTGEVFNLTALEVATEVASALHADKLLCLTEKTGLKDSRKKLMRQLSMSDAATMLNGRARLNAEDRAHLEAAFSACQNKVRRVHLVDRHVDGALLLELFTRDGIGTLISGDVYEGTRQATIEDVGGILELIKPLEEAGILVRRSREQLELEIGRYNVIDRDGTIIGCAALFPFSEENTGELACLAVHPDYRRGGRGDALLQYTEAQARQLGLHSLFVLTTRAIQWFQERGFTVKDKSHLPGKRQALYNLQRNSKVLLKPLD